MLHLNEIPTETQHLSVEHISVEGISTQWRKTATNDISYFRGILTWTDLPDDLQPYVPLFASVRNMNSKQLIQRH
jgi:Zn-dependent M16 (insulinase) family peptidase